MIGGGAEYHQRLGSTWTVESIMDTITIHGATISIKGHKRARDDEFAHGI